jgi:hypothetical protein
VKNYTITWLWTGWATTFGRHVYHPGTSYPSDPIGWRFRPVQFRPSFSGDGAWCLDIGPIRISRLAPCTCGEE